MSGTSRIFDSRDHVTSYLHIFEFVGRATPRLPRLKYRLKPLPPNHIEQGQRRAFGLFGASLQLRDVAGGEIEIAGECGLAQVCALPQAANLFAADGFGRTWNLRAKQANGDLLDRPSTRLNS